MRLVELDELGGNDLVRALVEIFLRDTPRFVAATLDPSLTSKDAERAVHTLRSSATGLGLGRLARVAAILEDTLGHRGPVTPEMLEELEAAHREAELAVRALLGAGSI